MIIMQFTSQIILLAIGFGVGYALLVHAKTQEGNMRTIGQTLGGILIVMAVILSMFSCYYSMKTSNRGYMQSGCPVQKMINQPTQGTMRYYQGPMQEDQTPSDETESVIDNENRSDGQDGVSGPEGTPIKSNIKDHE